MIILTLVGIAVIIQWQLTDYMDPGQRESDTRIKRYQRRNVSQTIAARLRKLEKRSKKSHPFHTFKERQYIIKTLDDWINPPEPRDTLAQTIQVPKTEELDSPILDIDTEGQRTIMGELQGDQPSPSPFEGPYLNGLPYNFFDRFPGIPAVTQEMFCKDPYLAEEWTYYQEVDQFTGLFQDLLLLNADIFAYWDDVETEIRQKGFNPKGFSVKEFVKWEFFRHSQGLDNYEHAHDIFAQYDRTLLAQVFEHPDRIPRPYHASYYYKWLTPAHFHAFLLRLVQECVYNEIIIPKIVMADGLFERSAAGNFSLDKFLQPTDPDATRTVHNKVYLGKGFMAIVFCAWCGHRWLPVDVRVFSGSTNENAYFKPTVADFLETTPYDWKAILYDTGASAKANRKFAQDQRLIAGITARSNIKREEILQLGSNRYAFVEDIPDGMSIRQYRRLLEHRSQTEAIFSPFSTVFDMKRMNSMGQAAAMIHMCKYLSLLLLHALSAFKVNAPRLVMKAKAFTQLV